METVLLVKEIAIVVLVVVAIGLVGLVLFAMVKLLPPARRTLENLEQTSAAIAKAATDFAAVSHSVAQNVAATSEGMKRSADNVAETAKYLMETTQNIAEATKNISVLSSGNIGQIAARFGEENIKELVRLAREYGPGIFARVSNRFRQ
ncbi:MAG: hypothetical protein F4W95_14810 [Chloroflexi bacterium]|nr:hypothetical protein [Chloroflexota bacterium]MYD49730.1 hypothetical protein [Chloroflexota bacterium]